MRPCLICLEDVEYGKYCKLPEKAVIGVLRGFPEKLPKAIEFIGRSFLDDAMKETYRAIVTERTAELGHS